MVGVIFEFCQLITLRNGPDTDLVFVPERKRSSCGEGFTVP